MLINFQSNSTDNSLKLNEFELFYWIELFLIWLQAEVKFNNDRNLSYNCSYTPQMEGAHQVTVSSFFQFNIWQFNDLATLPIGTLINWRNQQKYLMIFTLFFPSEIDPEIHVNYYSFKLKRFKWLLLKLIKIDSIFFLN